jgi:hypothetical protein
MACLAALPLAISAEAIHLPNDRIPDFSATPTIVSAANGSWSAASTWAPVRVPEPSDIVRIAHAVAYDSDSGDVNVVGITAGGTLQFATNSGTKLRVGTLQVLEAGALEVGTAADPIAAGVTAEIVIKDTPLHPELDPDQFGTGVLVIDGRITMHGAPKSPTFVRVDTEPLAGHRDIELQQPVTGWRSGDRVFLPDTRQVPEDQWFNSAYQLHIDDSRLANVPPGASSLTIASPLAYDHRGARDADGTPTVLDDGTKLLPHIGNLTRNVIVRSENPSGTRGHVLLTNRAAVDVRYVQFQDLGRTRADALDAKTNHIGRYPLHAHHLIGPVNRDNTGYQFALVGNAVADSLKWPIAIHGSHFGLIKGNVVFGGAELTGSGIAVEDGTETENLFEENFVAVIRGDVNPRESGPSTADGTTPGSAAECFWSTGFNNRFVNNVAASCRNVFQQIVSGPGWKFVLPAAPYRARIPRVRGAEMRGAQTMQITPQEQHIPEFRGNEVYGLAADGLTLWQLGTDGYAIAPDEMGESVIEDFRVWHTYEGAIWNYPANRMTADGLVYRVDPGAIDNYWPVAFSCGDYRNIDITIRGGSIHAGNVFARCIDPVGTYVIENVQAVTRHAAFVFETPATPGTQAGRPSSGVRITLRNNRVQPWPGEPLRTISMEHDVSRPNNHTDEPYGVTVFDYQGTPGDDFRVFFEAQANEELYGERASCTEPASRAEIEGITCAQTAAPTGAALDGR